MKKCLKYVGVLAGAFILFSAFIRHFNEDKPVPIPATPQRTGNAQKGFEYLTTGDYVKSGIPYNIFLIGAGITSKNYLNRSGNNKVIAHEYTAVTAYNGEVVVAPNCLQCHAQVFNDSLIIGLGNTFIDFSKGEKLNLQRLNTLATVLQNNAPRQYEAAAPFLIAAKTISPRLFAAVRGVNLADRLAGLLVAHRDPVTFKWTDTPMLPIPDQIIPSDTPPWWLLKKKNAMFYTGLGRGDFGRFLMASNLLTVKDTSESAEVDRRMPDVLSYIYSLTPPRYPKTTDAVLVEKGKLLFEANCAKCHGKYGEKEEYPNLLIPQSIIKTDSFLSQSNYSNPQFVNWFNKSWFTMGDHPARLQTFKGYIAPPLDGIWITAPFLHNGSVPTLEALLNSKLRPKYWSRNFDKPEYDYESIGWKYSVDAQPKKESYNTTLPGYGNYGHYFGDKFSDAERKAVIEYLKTL